MRNKKILISFLLLLFIPLIASELVTPIICCDEIISVLIGDWERTVGHPDDTYYKTYKISDYKDNKLLFCENCDDSPRMYHLYDFKVIQNKIKAILQPIYSEYTKPIVIEVVNRDSLYMTIGSTCFGLSRKGPYYGFRNK